MIFHILWLTQYGKATRIHGYRGWNIANNFFQTFVYHSHDTVHCSLLTTHILALPIIESPCKLPKLGCELFEKPFMGFEAHDCSYVGHIKPARKISTRYFIFKFRKYVLTWFGGWSGWNEGSGIASSHQLTYMARTIWVGSLYSTNCTPCLDLLYYCVNWKWCENLNFKNYMHHCGSQLVYIIVGFNYLHYKLISYAL